MKFFAFLKTILKNYKIVILYAVTVYNSKIIWLKDKHDLTIKAKVRLCYFNLHRKMKLPSIDRSDWTKNIPAKFPKFLKKTGEIQLNNCKSCESGFINSANLAICCLLKTHEKYGTAYTNLYGVEIEIKKIRQDAQTENQWQIWVKKRVQATFVVDIHKRGW